MILLRYFLINWEKNHDSFYLRKNKKISCARSKLDNFKIVLKIDLGRLWIKNWKKENF